ncbi:cupin domain-containing protein [Microvirga lotononidis]|uniref:Cupin domain-containing protein n=1 Tax=Microvirga lotononidis TaxID=864069 RepID=I4YSY3_9HYPH|nr:cupin domain-containing protein [Microvirga lotononidis]EIM27075.1 cupin domain-containing protein [Microvirga lotononidis]WQO28736.1 cupin domain-containing protein [Microvirga lotononidis]
MTDKPFRRAVLHGMAQARPIWVLSDRVSVIGHLEDQDLYIADVTVPPGGGTPPHMHPAPEILRVLDGTILFWSETDKGALEVQAKPGDVFTVPGGVPHGYRNAGDEDARMMLIADRRMVDFFRDAGSPVAPPPGPPSEEDIGQVMKAAARHGFTILV